jgi:hypothetical protein
MRFKISALLITGIFIVLFLSCEMGNSEAEIELSKKRIAEISELERQIADIEAKISAKIRAKSFLRGKLFQDVADSKISELKSKREILVIKFRELYKIEQEYQSRK